MSCRKYRKYIELDDLLTEAQAARLQQHIQICAGCARLWRNRQAFKQNIELMQDHPPVPEQPQILTEAIMSSLPVASAKAGAGRSKSTLMSLFLQQRVRLALVGLLVLLLNALALQEAAISYRLWQWEQKAASQTVQPYNVVAFSGHSIFLRYFAGSAQARELMRQIEKEATQLATLIKKKRDDRSSEEMADIASFQRSFENKWRYSFSTRNDMLYYLLPEIIAFLPCSTRKEVAEIERLLMRLPGSKAMERILRVGQVRPAYNRLFLSLKEL
ncbi:zf-HC2 domain-containing protein [candidate division KSB1 bacterium]|nr:zf-HC2 domain-containing protein [candidate division KSB1 bacterium]